MIITKMENGCFMVTKPAVKLEKNEINELRYDLTRKTFESSRYRFSKYGK